jgi:acetyl-CoA carboxylase carboxyltransferase component
MRFIGFCDHFRLPLVTFVDVPGFLPGLDQEEAGLAQHGAELMRAYAQATVPKITVILGQAYGAAAIMMGSKQLGANNVFAWPSAKIGLTNESGSDLSAAEAVGVIDAIIQPSETRKHLIEALTTGRISVEAN